MSTTSTEGEAPESPGGVDADNPTDRGVEEHASPFPLYLSPSQVSSLLMCGEQFRLTRLEKVPERPMWAGIGGTTVHRVTEILDRRKWAGDSTAR